MAFARLNGHITRQQTPTSAKWSSPSWPLLFHSRKFRHRSSLLAILAMLGLSIYYYFIQGAATGYYGEAKHHDSSYVAAAVRPNQKPTTAAARHGSGKHANLYKSSLILTPEQELAAISGFLASLPQNVIPSSVDPFESIDPQLVLDFDTRGPRVQEDLAHMVTEVWTANPVLLYCKHYSPLSRQVKAILESFNLSPSPTIIDVDVREDADVLKPILQRLTAPEDFPILLLGGKPVGSIAEIRALHESGQLQKLITEAGGVVNGAKRRKHRR